MGTATQYENVTFTVAGANPQSKTVQVTFTIDTVTGIGTASTTFSYTGSNGGTDTVSAALSALGFTSNPATVVWQATNGIIAVSNPVNFGILGAADAGGWSHTSPQPFTSQGTSPGSLYLNMDGTSNLRSNISPSAFYVVTAQGAFSGSSVALPTSGVIAMVLTGYFVVGQSGNVVLNWGAQDDYILGIGPAISGGGTVSSVSNSPFLGAFSGTTTPFKGYPLLMAANPVRHGSAPNASYYGTLKFSAPGIYPFEIDFDGGGDGNFLAVKYNGGTNASGLNIPGGTVIPPVFIVSAPAQPAPGTQNLVLTPTGGNSNLLLQGQQVTLSLTLTASFVTQSFIPILEGVLGQVYVYNDPVSPTFTFPIYYGVTPDGPSAAIQDFTLAGDNTAWQGQISLQWNASLSRFQLYYNGSQSLAANQLLAPNVQDTNLIVTQEDIAWFNPSGPEYDTFQATASGGGKFTTVPIYYQLNPNYPAGTAIQVSPTTAVTGVTPPPSTFPVTAAYNPSFTQSGTTGTLYFLDYRLSPAGDPHLNALFASGPFYVTFLDFSGLDAVGNGPSGGPNFLNNTTQLVTALNHAGLGNHDDQYWYMQFTLPNSASKSYLGNPSEWGINYQAIGGAAGGGTPAPPAVGNVTFTVTLARPLPPIQNNTVMSVTFSGAIPTGVTVTPNLVTIGGVAGWLVSYTVTATWPAAAVATTSTMFFTFVAPSITFLGGSYKLTAAANAVGGNTTYSGVFSPIPPTGSRTSIAGFAVNASNNGTFTVQPGSSGTSLILNNPSGVAETAGGGFPATTYYIRTTWKTATGESLPGPEGSQLIPAYQSLVVGIGNMLPAPVNVIGWNVYVSTSSQTETRQNGNTPIALNAVWTEPSTGLVSGAALPTSPNVIPTPLLTPNTSTTQVTATVLDAISTFTNYTYPPPPVQPQAIITLQASNAPSSAPQAVSLTVWNGANQLQPGQPSFSQAPIHFVATWISSSNNFEAVTFYGTVPGSSRAPIFAPTLVGNPNFVVTSLGGGKYQAVVTSPTLNGVPFPLPAQYSFVGTCTDNSSVSYLNTNYYYIAL